LRILAIAHAHRSFDGRELSAKCFYLNSISASGLTPRSRRNNSNASLNAGASDKFSTVRCAIQPDQTAVDQIERGHSRSWTEAAHASAFADSAHLMRTFKRMFGMNPVALVPR